jgi:hypothetical protein
MEEVEQSPRASGGCLCGKIRFEIYQPLRQVSICHCKQCRQSAGYLAGFTVCDPENLVFLKDEGLKWYDSSDFAKRGFCENCGSSIFWTEKKGGNMGIAAGSLDEPTGLTSGIHIFTEYAGDYYEIKDDLPQRKADRLADDVLSSS